MLKLVEIAAGISINPEQVLMVESYDKKVYITLIGTEEDDDIIESEYSYEETIKKLTQ
jgi:hypothetical protein